jgi:hypothetical protein
VECSPGVTLTLCEFISSERGGGEPFPSFFLFFWNFLANGDLKNQNGKKQVFSRIELAEFSKKIKTINFSTYNILVG